MRLAILAAGLLLIVIGIAAMVNGWSIVLVERGWAQFIAGSMLLSAGAILTAISAVVAKLDAVIQGTHSEESEGLSRPATPSRPPLADRPPQGMQNALPSPQDMPLPLPIPAPLPPFVPSVPAAEAEPAPDVAVHETAVQSASLHETVAQEIHKDIRAYEPVIPKPVMAAPAIPEPVISEPAVSEAPIHAPEPPKPSVPKPFAPEPFIVAPPPVAPPPKGRISIGALAGAASAAAAGVAIFGRRSEPTPRPVEPPAPPKVVEAPPEPTILVAPPAPQPAASIDPTETLKRLEAEIEGKLFGAAPPPPEPPQMPKVAEGPLAEPIVETSPLLPPAPEAVGQDNVHDDVTATADIASPPMGQESVQESLQESSQEIVEEITEEIAPAAAVEQIEAGPAGESTEADELAWLDAALRGIELPKEPEWVTRSEPAEPAPAAAPAASPAAPVSPRDHAAIMRTIEERLEHTLLDDAPNEAAPHEAAEPEPLPVPEIKAEAEPEPVSPLAVEPAPGTSEPAPEPEPELALEPTPAPDPEPEVTIVRRYESQGVIYTLYDNGSVDAETSSGLFHFKSLDELREFLTKPA
ncbi:MULTISPECIES: hypothetical protein [unclassified Beijerinckia]|uniref:hypothetical protein n=1 Tax=unclassified Beijerinckia TaxID=2638183 RepID=UPI0008979EC5|nr:MULTISPECIES: hypothetical protein [unclassified Beijerinckia]MDH7796364.1 hypothetical protein [Beijerinckia sp. GAS462]SEC41980.1 hypothetical protein SAMN05443249_2647 [Beijerinckia sp. 28-YEA-48]